ncbi:MAG: Xaa-Pro aminopeptidase [Gammaproteobacteria bacterium]|jgi:Xaa-Pro aminopeptidase
MITKQEFSDRRKQLFAKMRPHSVAVIFAAPQYFRNGNVTFPYRQNSDFYYLTGFTEPNAVAVFIKSTSAEQYVLFSQPKDLVKEQWCGFRVGQEKAIEAYGVDQAYSIDEIDKHMQQLLQDVQAVYYQFNHPLRDNELIDKWLGQRNKGPWNINSDSIIHEMRLIKSPAEIKLLKQAAEITAHAHLKVMRQCKPKMYEYELLGKLLHEYYTHGAQAAAFPPIVASGDNSCVLHYEENNRQIRDDDLVLVDAGCEYQYYAADVARTFPANGKFTREQALIYEIVLLAQQKVIEQIRPGSNWYDGQKVAARTITEGLCDLGILRGNVDELIEQQAYKPFYMHKVSHWLGLDAHDVGAFKIDDQERQLQPGMVLTVEPGIYILPNMKDVDKKWWGIGVRIEDDLLVTEDGHEVLTNAAPKTIEEIEEIL